MRQGNGSAWRDANRYRWVPAVAVGLTLAAFILLHYTGRTYRVDQVLQAWGVIPFRTPFLDADTVMSALRCIRQGIDVFETNPCDPLGRVYDYSPLWLHAATLPFTPAWIVPVGLAVDALFIAALLLLPAVPQWWQVRVLVVAVLSPPVAFAVERANNDLVIFGLAALTAVMSVRSLPLRLAGLACAFVAGLLKYYPLLLMTFALRERLRWFVGITIVSFCAFAVFVWAEYIPLVKALGLIPTGRYFGDMFGARTLSAGLAYLLNLPPMLGRIGELTCDVISVGVAMRLAWGGWLQVDLAGLSALALSFLVTGALLVIACFSTAQNIGYRAIHLVLIVPAFVMLAGNGGRRRFWAFNSAVVVILLWAEGWRHWLEVWVANQPIWIEAGWSAGTAPYIAAWLLREACWWWIVTILLAVLFTTASRSRAVVEAAALLTRSVQTPNSTARE